MLGRSLGLMAMAALLEFPHALFSLTTDEIIERSAQVVHTDWEKAPDYDHCVTALSAAGKTTTAVLMLNGSPYYRVVARDGIALSAEDRKSEQAKYEAAARDRGSETPEEHDRRIAGYESERLRNQLLLEEFTKAMHFELAGTATMSGRETYVIRGKPRSGYTPRSKETKVLTGMVGTIWVDRDSFHWVRVEAEVTQSVAVAGFIATVMPGTKFELQEAPLDENIWLVAHFSMKTSTRVFFLFHRRTEKDETYFNYQRTGSLLPESCAATGLADAE